MGRENGRPRAMQKFRKDAAATSAGAAGDQKIPIAQYFATMERIRLITGLPKRTAVLRTSAAHKHPRAIK